jgi:hypothetical protein
VFFVISQKRDLDPRFAQAIVSEFLYSYQWRGIPNRIHITLDLIKAPSKELLRGGHFYPEIEVIDDQLKLGGYIRVRLYGDYVGPFVRWIVYAAGVYGVPLENWAEPGSILDRYLRSWFHLKRVPK